MKFLDFFFKSFIFEYNHSKTVSGVFHDLKNVKIAENSWKIGQLLQILATWGLLLYSFSGIITLLFGDYYCPRFRGLFRQPLKITDIYFFKSPI
jgi:hypothetical protein